MNLWIDPSSPPHYFEGTAKMTNGENGPKKKTSKQLKQKGIRNSKGKASKRKITCKIRVDKRRVQRRRLPFY